LLDADATAYTTLGGVRFSQRRADSAARFFYHVLGGSVESDGYFYDSAWAFGGGIGLDVDFSERISIRVFRIDQITTFFNDGSQSNLRFNAGIVFKLGAR
jgi:hypothetical protein